MGQTDLNRTSFLPQEEITSLANDDRQLLAFTGYYNVGDVVEIVDVDANGCRISVLGTRTIVAIEKDVALIFDSAIDTSAAVGTPYAYVTDIDDGQEAIDRLYHQVSSPGTCQIVESILGQALGSPIAGQATYEVGDVGFFRAGDSVTILADEGLVGTATIVSVNEQADEANNRSEIVINSATLDTTGLTNPRFQLVMTVCDGLARLRSDIDLIDKPVENEDLDTPNCSATAFETNQLFKAGTSKVYLDGRKLRLGTAGSRAAATVGAGNSALTYTSMILGTDGNATDVSVTAGAGLVVTVTGNYTTGYAVDCTDNGGAATSAQIAAAINADATAKRIVQVVYGGTGAGVVTAFAATPLAGGLNNGTGDYAELPQVFENQISLTGYKWVSLWILPGDRNRLNSPPRNSEELSIDYRTILYNA